MPTLTIMPSATAVEVAEGASILSALLAAELMAPPKCGGNASCGGCHIYVQDGRKSVSKMQKAENEKLDSIIGVSSKSRLACQTLIGTEPVTIELLDFKSGF
jgi:2Fe-2S ferredoxin